LLRLISLTPMVSSSSDLMLLLLLLLLVTSSGIEPYPLALVPRVAPLLPRSLIRIGPTVKSHDPGAWPLSDGVVKWANRQSSQLLHELFRFRGVPESEGPTLLEGTVEARQGTVSMRLVVWWQSMAPAVLGAGLVDRWRSTSSGVSPALLGR
jgi:hypothetical protein